MKMDVVLVAADALLKNGDEELKNQTHSKLKELKTLWEETSTYIVHCHRYGYERCTFGNFDITLKIHKTGVLFAA